MAFTRPTLQQLIDRKEADLTTRLGASTLLRRSVIKVFARVGAGAEHLIYGFILFMVDQLFVTTAIGDGLNLLGSDYNLNRTAAVMKAAGNTTATGTTGILIPEDTELQSNEGVRYLVDSDVTLAGGIGILAVTAKVAGDDGNESAGVILTFISPIVGIDSDTAIDSSGIIGGSDIETIEEYRARILRRKQLPSRGGADFDYVTWCLEVSGVTRAWAIAGYFGDGSVGVVFVRDNDDSIIPDSTEIATVRAYLVEHTDPVSGGIIGIAVGAGPGLIMLTLELLSVDFEINISPNTATIQAAINAQLDDLIARDGGPEQTLRLSRISEAISLATDEAYHTLVGPIIDITANADQIHIKGAVVFGDY